jgi:hypothetical protein
MPPRTTNARMSSPQAPMPNTRGTVMHVVSVYRATLCSCPQPLQCPSHPRLSVRSAVQAQAQAQARMSDEKGYGTYAFNQKCAAQTSSAGVLIRCGMARSAKRSEAICQCDVPRCVYDFDARDNHMRFASPALGVSTDATYKIPEKQKILPMPKRTLKMIGTAEQSVSNQHESSQTKWGILPSCSDHQRLMRAIVPIQCTLQARKKNTHGQQQHIKRSKKGSPPIRSFSTQEQGNAKLRPAAAMQCMGFSVPWECRPAKTCKSRVR